MLPSDKISDVEWKEVVVCLTLKEFSFLIREN
jgi:hypothetical protein